MRRPDGMPRGPRVSAAPAMAPSVPPDADEAEEPPALLAAQEVGHEAPEDRHGEEVEDARPDEETRATASAGLGREASSSAEQDECRDQDAVDDRDEDPPRKARDERTEERVERDRAGEGSDEEPGEARRRSRERPSRRGAAGSRSSWRESRKKYAHDQPRAGPSPGSTRTSARRAPQTRSSRARPRVRLRGSPLPGREHLALALGAEPGAAASRGRSSGSVFHQASVSFAVSSIGRKVSPWAMARALLTPREARHLAGRRDPDRHVGPRRDLLLLEERCRRPR